MPHRYSCSKHKSTFNKFCFASSNSMTIFNMCFCVILKAFYPLILIVSYKFGVHYNKKKSHKTLIFIPITLGDIFALLTLNLYALRC
nr:MAG TPA: hypothetical protein [Bacteriophage sp.]